MAPFGGSGGSGLVMARLPDGSWSPPSFITPQNVSAGLMFGLDVYDVVLLIMSETALEGFKTHKVTVGAETAIAAGPVGTGASMDMSVNGVDWTKSKDKDLAAEENKRKISKPPPPLFSYTRNRGFYGGIEGMAMVYLTRFDENERVYHWPGVTGRDVLDGRVRKPVEARMLYDALAAAESGQAQASVSDLRLPPELDNSSLAFLSQQSNTPPRMLSDSESVSIAESTRDGSSVRTGSDEGQSPDGSGPLLLDDGERLHLPPTPEQLDFMEQAGVKDEEDVRLEADYKAYVWSLPAPPRHPAATTRATGITRTKAGKRFVAPLPLPLKSPARLSTPDHLEDKETPTSLERSLSHESTGTLKAPEPDSPPAYTPSLQPIVSVEKKENEPEDSEEQAALVPGALSSKSSDAPADTNDAEHEHLITIEGNPQELESLGINSPFEESPEPVALENERPEFAKQGHEQHVSSAAPESTEREDALSLTTPANPADDIANKADGKAVDASEQKDLDQTEVTTTTATGQPSAEHTNQEATSLDESAEAHAALDTPTLGNAENQTEGPAPPPGESSEDLAQTAEKDAKKSRRKTATELLLDTMWSSRSGSPAPGLGLLPEDGTVSTPVGRSFTPGRLFAPDEKESSPGPDKSPSATDKPDEQKMAVPVARRDSLHLGADDDDLDDEADAARDPRETSESGPSSRQSIDSWQPDYGTDDGEENTTDAFAMLSRRFSSLPASQANSSQTNGHASGEHLQTQQDDLLSAASIPAALPEAKEEAHSDTESNDNFAEAESHDHSGNPLPVSETDHAPAAQNVQDEKLAENSEPNVSASPAEPQGKAHEPTQPSTPQTPTTFTRPARARPASVIAASPARPTTPGTPTGTPTGPSTPAASAPHRPQRSAIRPPRSSARPTSMFEAPRPSLEAAPATQEESQP